MFNFYKFLRNFTLLVAIIRRRKITLNANRIPIWIFPIESHLYYKGWIKINDSSPREH